MDSSLKMDKHINSITRKASMSLYNIGRIRRYLTTEATKTLVHAFIISRLDYANGILYGLPDSSVFRLQKIQNHAARLVTKTKKYDHITPVLKELHWLPVKDRIKYKILSLAHNSVHKIAPIYMQNLVSIYHPNRSLRSENQMLMTAPRTLTTYGDRTFTAAVAKLWNELPYELRCIEHIKNFQKQLKTLLFNN